MFVGVAVPSMATVDDRLCPMIVTKPTNRATATATVKRRRVSTKVLRGKSFIEMTGESINSSQEPDYIPRLDF